MILVAISGIDGSGKTRLARGIAHETGGLYRKQSVGRRFNRAVSEQGHPDLATLPSPHGQILAEAYAADFTDYARSHGGRATRPGGVVVLDRWSLCVLAFADVFAPNPGRIRQMLADTVTAKFEFLLDLDASLALDRIRKRGASDWDEQLEVLAPLRQAYLNQATARTVVLDAACDEIEVRRQALSAIGGRLASR